MFHTDETHRHPFSNIFGPRTSTWEVVEVALESPWLVVVEVVTEQADDADADADDEDDSYTIRRTVLLSSLESLEGMLQSQEARSSIIEAVWVMTPGWMNETGDWKMSRGAKLLVGQFDVSSRGDFFDQRLLQTADGLMISFGVSMVDPCDVREIRELYEFPVQSQPMSH